MAYCTTMSLPTGKPAAQHAASAHNSENDRAEPVSQHNETTGPSHDILMTQVLALEALVETMMVTIGDTSERMKLACAESNHVDCHCSTEMGKLQKQVSVMKRLTMMHMSAQSEAGDSAAKEH